VLQQAEDALKKKQRDLASFQAKIKEGASKVHHTKTHYIHHTKKGTTTDITHDNTPHPLTFSFFSPADPLLCGFSFASHPSSAADH
jgi:hypothetical protein